MKITQSLSDLPTNESGKSLETRLREKATRLRTSKSLKDDKIVKIKRIGKSKYKKIKQTRYIRQSKIFIIDEARHYLKKL